VDAETRQWTCTDNMCRLAPVLSHSNGPWTWVRDEEAPAQVGSFGARPGQETPGGPGREERCGASTGPALSRC
jgi:hypothetical protein